MLDRVRVNVYGKINLSLNVGEVKNGKHELDSVVASVSVCDTITVRDRIDGNVNLIFNAPFSVENNIVLKAVELLRTKFGGFGADIIVDKRLPLGGGMGGSSADAAGVIVALEKLFDLNKRGLDISEVCSLLGSDIFYMTQGGYARMQGSGNKLSPVCCDRRLDMVYITASPTITSEVYKRFDILGGDGKVDTNEVIASLNGDVKLGNMLYRAAASFNAEIKKHADAMAEIGLKSNMTGSGSTVYAITDDAERSVDLLRKKGFEAHTMFTLPYGIKFE